MEEARGMNLPAKENNLPEKEESLLERGNKKVYAHSHGKS